MLLLGVVQAQAAGDEISGSFDLLETQVLTSNAASLTFSSINATYGSTYKHLQVRLTGFKTGGGGSRLYMRINGATAYNGHFMLGNGSGVISERVISNGIRIINNFSSDPPLFSGAFIDVLDSFVTTKNTTVRCLEGAGSPRNRLSLSSGFLANTSAVDSIAFATGNLNFGDGGSLGNGSRFSLYGIKAD